MSDVYSPIDNQPSEKPDATVVLADLPAARAQSGRVLGEAEEGRALRPDELAQSFGEERHSDEEWARAATKAQRELREQRGGIQDQPPLVEIKAPRGRESYKNAKEAAADLSFTRK